ncbi:MAG TPA: hypothetical protein VEB66_01050 [Opitutaceae bacterium]|nr:hypothetical protein [Opitutaceae bacterium]
MRLLTAPALLLGFALLAGCNTTTHRVRIEASVNTPPAGTPPPASFWIKSRQNDPRVETLRYHEAIGHIRTALSGRGLYQAPSEETADMVIEVDYGAAPKRQRVEVDDSRQSARRAEKPAAAASAPGETARPALVERSPEQRGEIMIDVGVYRKHLTLEARQNRAKAGADGGPEFLWRVQVENEDENKDLRKYVPILASATIDYIATETAGEKEVTVDESGKDVAFVKKGL